MRNRQIILGIKLLVFGLVVGSSLLAFAKDVDKSIVAKVDNAVITLDELNKKVTECNDMIKKTGSCGVLSKAFFSKLVTPQQKITFLKNETIKLTLMYQEALRRGLDKKKEIKNLLFKKTASQRREILAKELVKQEISSTKVGAEEIKDYYEAYKIYFKTPKERHMHEIVVHTEKEAKEIYIKLLKGEDFAALAKARSKAASAVQGGDLGFINGLSRSTLFNSVAFSEALKTGGLSQIFELPEGGYCILKLEAKRGGEQRQFSEIKGDIEKGLLSLKQQQKIYNLTRRLTNQAKIEIYKERIK